MNILVGEVLQAWDQLSENFLSVAGAKSKMKVVLDFAHITPKIIGMFIIRCPLFFKYSILALGDVADTHLEELVQMTNHDPIVIWNLG